MVHHFRGSHRHADRGLRVDGAGPLGGQDSAPRRNPQRLKAIRRLLAAGLLLAFPARAALPDLHGHKALHHPLVLIHGATIHGGNLKVGPFDLGEYFKGLPEFLASSGTKVKVVELPTDGTIEEHASALKNFLETDPDLKGQPVNVIGHSLGGLDARWCISVLHTTQIASVTTIGTPHRGTPLADWAVNEMDNKYPWYWFFKFVGYELGARRFLRELTTSSMSRFNLTALDSPDVRYFSVRTRANFSDGDLSFLLWFPNHWLESQNNALGLAGSDGLVPYDSQAWGKEVTSSSKLDHLGQMNHHELRRNGQEAEALRIYQAIYDNLEAAGL